MTVNASVYDHENDELLAQGTATASTGFDVQMDHSIRVYRFEVPDPLEQGFYDLDGMVAYRPDAYLSVRVAVLPVNNDTDLTYIAYQGPIRAQY